MRSGQLCSLVSFSLLSLFVSFYILFIFCCTKFAAANFGPSMREILDGITARKSQFIALDIVPASAETCHAGEFQSLLFFLFFQYIELRFNSRVMRIIIGLYTILQSVSLSSLHQKVPTLMLDAFVSIEPLLG